MCPVVQVLLWVASGKWELGLASFGALLAGGTSVVCTYPLDVIRARLAVQRQYHKYNGVTDAFTTLLKEEVREQASRT